MTIFGYARVSTDGQTLDAQVAALKRAGAAHVFHEKVSGAKTARRELARALNALGKGDVLIVTRLDRLARSTRDLLNTLVTEMGLGSAGSASLARARELASECRAQVAAGLDPIEARDGAGERLKEKRLY
jgi:predicted site-specific integrase-resolvase